MHLQCDLAYIDSSELCQKQLTSKDQNLTYNYLFTFKTYVNAMDIE